MRKEAKNACAYFTGTIFFKCTLPMCKSIFVSPLANDASVCYGMSRLSFLIMKMYRMLFDVFRYRIKDSLICIVINRRELPLNQ